MFVPPLVVPPLSCKRTDTVATPAIFLVWKLKVPFVVMVGWTTNELVFPAVTTKLQVWVLSLDGPATMFVTKLVTTIVVLYFVTTTLLVVSVKLGASFTEFTVSTKEFVDV